MTVFLMTSLRLFANGLRPRRSLTLRLAGLAATIVALTFLVGALTPEYLQLSVLPPGYVAALASLISFLFVSLTFFMLGGYQSGFILRLRVLRYLPIDNRRLLRLYMLGYAPLGLLSLVLSVVANLKFFAGGLPPPVLLFVLITSNGLAVGYNVLLRLSADPLARWPQVSCLVGMISAGWLSWQLVARAGHWAPGLCLTVIFQVLHAVLIVQLLKQPLRSKFSDDHCKVKEYCHLSIWSQLAARATRTRRYLVTNLLIVATLGGLALLARHRPLVASFDLAAAATMLLIGTLGQEARCLSRRFYPLEAINYGQIARWVTATWLITLANSLLLTGLVIAIARLWFPAGLSIGYIHLLGLGVCLTALGVLAASAIVPTQSDALAQLASTGLYCLLAWLSFKLLGRLDDLWLLLPAAGLVVTIGSAVSYALEKLRWNITIRGRRAVLFRTS